MLLVSNESSWIIQKAFSLNILRSIFHSANRESRILGGRNAFPGEVPYQASLRYWGSTFHFAGGVLVNTRYVVTGAYNLRGRAANSINIVLGIVSLDTGVINRQSDYIVIHDQFAIEGNIIKNE